MKKYNLLVVAHPDDETIFFGGLVQSYRRRPWKIICVTDGNANGQGPQRHQDFMRACKKLKAHTAEIWDFQDIYNVRLDVNKVVARLENEEPSEIFTHGILGEYGHPHHQDVSLAVHRAFAQKLPWSVAYNCFAAKVIRVPRRAFQRKCEILSEIYFSETHRFARWLPASNHEGFCKVSLKEVEALHAFFSRGVEPPVGQLKVYSWFSAYLAKFRDQISTRRF